jgi:hypothetical protein
VSLTSLATNKGVGRKQKNTYTFVFERKLLKALVFLSNNPEIP